MKMTYVIVILLYVFSTCFATNPLLKVLEHPNGFPFKLCESKPFNLKIDCRRQLMAKMIQNEKLMNQNILG